MYTLKQITERKQTLFLYRFNENFTRDCLVEHIRFHMILCQPEHTLTYRLQYRVQKVDPQNRLDTYPFLLKINFYNAVQFLNVLNNDKDHKNYSYLASSFYFSAS